MYLDDAAYNTVYEQVNNDNCKQQNRQAQQFYTNHL